MGGKDDPECTLFEYCAATLNARGKFIAHKHKQTILGASRY